MKFFLRLGLILLAFCAIATALLAFVNSITQPRIELLKAEQERQARASLLPGVEFERVAQNVPGADSLIYYIGRAEDTKEIKGYTFTAAKVGYSSTVKTMAAVDSEFKLLAIKVIEQAETPGLGANATAPTFTDQFKGLAPDQILVDKDGGQIKSLTGATITSRAIANSLTEQITAVRLDAEQRLAAPGNEEVTP